MAKFEREGGIAQRVYADDDTVLPLEERITKLPHLSTDEIDALQQLVTPVWDGNLISKAARSSLCDKGLVSRWQGLNFCTQDGYCVLDVLGMLRNTDRFVGGAPKARA